MKLNLIFATATAVGLLMGSGAALAAGGNQTYLTQTGDGQSAVITQSGGSNNRVGSSGSPFVQENGAGSTGQNALTIDQNTASAGSGNLATGWQSGTKNNADIDQNGNNSSVNLTQLGAHNGDPSSATWFNDPGRGNQIVQDATASGSSVDLQQSNYIGADKGNIFNIGQGGSNNHVTATQTANSGQSSAAHNDLWIRQGTTAPDLWGWTNGTPFWTTAYGLSSSTITVHQDAGTLSGTNYAALGQGAGSGNAITASQTGASNNVDANQVGSGNIFQSQQNSADGNNGWNFVGGEAGWPSTGANPLVSSNGDWQPITQWGTGNQYYSVQSGTNLQAFGNQMGNYNFLSNTQSGDLNTLLSAQLGDSNTIYSTQSGDSNTTTVSQSLNGNTSVTSQNGTGNIATVSQ